MKSGGVIDLYFLGISCVAIILLSLFLSGFVSWYTLVFIAGLSLPCLRWLVLKAPTNIKLLFASIFTLYVILEMSTYFLICAQYLRPDFYSIHDGEFGASDRAYARFDTSSGYKYISGETRLVNVHEGHLVYDLIMHVNSLGYPSIYEYPKHKQDSLARRLIVFGDSFSSGEITDTTWVDLLNKKLASHSGPKTEFFNFSLEAIGIRNWHKIFFNEIVPSYDFDGIVLAVVGDLNYYSSDLIRPFAIKNSSGNHTSLNFFESLPSTQAVFESHFKQQLYYESSIYPPGDIEQYKALATHKAGCKRQFVLRPIKAYLLQFMADALHFAAKRNSFLKRYSVKKADEVKNSSYFNWAEYESYYGPEKTILVRDILDYCVSHHKEIWLISMPSFNLAEKYPSHYRDNIYNRQLRFLASQYQAHFYDGYEMIDHIAPDHYKDYHLYGDTHWNRKGINLFLSLLPLK